MDEIIGQLSVSLPNISFRPGKVFCWSPKLKQVTYVPSSMQPQKAVWGLLHEASHALLGHFDYHTDFQLLQLEVAAWQKARELAQQLKQTIDEQHIQTCLDTYRDWLHQRSSCPLCGLRGVQSDPRHYQCLNCQTIWQVSTARFCRPYRSTKLKLQQKSPGLRTVPSDFR